MATNLPVTLHRAWWVLPYVQALAWFCWLTNMQPDREKLHRVLMRGFTLKVGDKRTSLRAG